MAAPGWIGETVRTYFGNATSVRDFRVQMRGSKTILAWTLYLGVLLTVGYFTYAAISSTSYLSSPAAIQSQLGSFFGSMMRVIAGAVIVIAPGLTAASIVGERQRQSFDLVFSAPVTPKYYLVGKMIASYRYTLMILVLSIPVIALSALLGGTTWGDILICYFLLSMSGLMCTALALLVSAVVEKLQTAIAASYLLVGLYLLVSFLAAASIVFTGTFGRGPIGEAAFIANLNPFMVPETYGTYTVLMGNNVPNWILTGVFTLLVVRFALLGAGSVLSPYGSKETKGLRLQGLIYLAGLSALGASISINLVSRGSISATFLTYVFMIVALIVPWLSAFGDSGRKVTEYDGPWNLRRVFFGTPSGAGPYIIALLAAVLIGSFYPARQSGIGWNAYFAHFVHGCGVVLFLAGATRIINVGTGFYKARALGVALSIGSLVVLPMFLSIAVASTSTYSTSITENPLWLLWPLWPVVAYFSESGLYLYGLAGAVAGVLMWLRAEAAAAASWRLANRIGGFEV